LALPWSSRIAAILSQPPVARHHRTIPPHPMTDPGWRQRCYRAKSQRPGPRRGGPIRHRQESLDARQWPLSGGPGRNPTRPPERRFAKETPRFSPRGFLHFEPASGRRPAVKAAEPWLPWTGPGSTQNFGPGFARCGAAVW
jgi:hypothetical protein